MQFNSFKLQNRKIVKDCLNPIDNAIILFQKYYLEKTNIQLEFKPDVHIAIALKHFTWLDRYSKQFLEQNSLANAYKIASCTELAIIRIQPILHQDRHLNAAFAVFSAQNIIEGVRNPEHFAVDVGPPILNHKLDEIEKDHINYLTIIDSTDSYAPPVNSNAAWWGLLHLFYQYRFQVILN